MAIPNYQELMLPVLKKLQHTDYISFTELSKLLGNDLDLTQEEKTERIPSGSTTVFKGRVGWAKTYLKQAGLIHYPKRGYVSLTERGKKVLQDSPVTVDNEYLKQFPEFIEFLNRSSAPSKKQELSPDTSSTYQETPDDLMLSAYTTIKEQTISELIDTIKSCSAEFFEHLVVDVIATMGYGGSHKEAKKAVGKSGDQGVDGIISEDRLGLEVIYLQAKRWENNIQRPEIDKFAGALQGKRAKKGIFITTSDFSAGAREYVKRLESKIILISGQQLAELMWEHDVGLHEVANYPIKKIDIDYFNEE